MMEYLFLKGGKGIFAIQIAFCMIWVSYILASMAKRRKYLSESEIFKLMNESESETEDSDFSSVSDSESNYSDDTEIIDYFDDNVDDNLNASDWQTNINELPPLEFSANTGIYINSSEPVEEELDFFNLFFTDEIIKIIVDETNKYSKCIFEKSKTGPSSSKSPDPKCIAEVTENEIRVFLSLVILMSIIKKPTIKMYFSTDPVLSTPFFSSVISRNRFLEILRCLHFTSNPDAKKLEKVNPVLEKLINNFKTVYIPEREISVDESLFPWKGRLGFRQYIPSKQNRYGIKIYKLSDSNSGYIWYCLVYIGKDTVLTEQGALYGECVVKTLLAELENKGYNLYLDRFFVSPALAKHLLQKKTNVCGTVQKKRKGMPKVPSEFKKDNIVAFQKEGVNVIGYKDKKKDVIMLTTFHGKEIIPTGKKDRKTGEDIEKPHCVVDYNKYMGGVDTGDSIMHHYPAFRKTVKWYRKLFFGFLDMAILNATIIFCKQKQKKCTSLLFRTNLVHQMIQRYKPAKHTKVLTTSQVANPLRLSGRHFPNLYKNSDGRKARRQCVVCKKSSLKEKKRKLTFYECKICNVGLCPEKCFEMYHKLQKF